MLMFDKVTQRHRGTCRFDLLTYLLTCFSLLLLSIRGCVLVLIFPVIVLMRDVRSGHLNATAASEN